MANNPNILATLATLGKIITGHLVDVLLANGHTDTPESITDVAMVITQGFARRHPMFVEAPADHDDLIRRFVWRFVQNPA